jgi:hypothetical protein
MGSTTWHPRTNVQPREWLLTNGEVVHEPALEESGSGLKVRVAGTKLTAYSKDVDDLIVKAVEAIAEQKQTSVWMRIQSSANTARNNEKPKLHVVGEPDSRYAKTQLYWVFKHPTLPIEATLTIELAAAYQYGSGDRPQRLHAWVASPDTTPNATTNPSWIHVNDGDYGGYRDRLKTYEQQTKFREFIRDTPPTPPLTDLLGEQALKGERQAVEHLLKKVRAADALASIQIPDLRDVENLAWLDLELFETNVNDKFITDLADYLDGAPSVEEAHGLYEQMLRTLRSVGIVMDPSKSKNDFQAALLSNEPLNVTVGPIAEVEHGRDHEHDLTMDLRTGTFIVNCSMRVANRNTIAEKWEEAQVLAQFTGKEDELLAYARRYAETEAQRRAEKILKERQTGEVVE